jgi:hypothetical protein
MPAQRATATKNGTPKTPRQRSATRNDACRLLQVAPTADDELVNQAYWHLARKCWADARHDPEARRKLEELNKAYLVVNPGKTEAPLSKGLPPLDEKVELTDEIGRWAGTVIEQVKLRWPGRGAELLALTIIITALVFLALTAGASAPWTLVAAGIAALTIWAPWRRL